MKKKINTNLFPIIHFGMYGSILSPDNMFDDYQINEEFKNGDIPYNADYFNDNFEYPKYVKEIQHQASLFLDGKREANGISIGITAGEIYSPKYYNFETDQIDLEVEYNTEEVLKYARENMVEFDTFLKENYSSYDGFSSSTANNYSEWVEDFAEENDQSIGAVLTFIFKDELEEYQQDFIQQCYENLFFSEFCDESNLEEEENKTEIN